MKVTRDVIIDLVPLYFANECSPDTRALVDEYLRENPREADEFRRIMAAPLPKAPLSAKTSEETRAFRETRRRLRVRGILMGFAIFFSLAPFSISNINGRVWWLVRDEPVTAQIYASIGLFFWFLYAVNRRRSRSL
jgi:hypothetical protein